MSAATWRVALVAGSFAAAVPALAGAEEPAESGWTDRLIPRGTYVMLGGGVTDFTDSSNTDRYDVGGAWDVRLGIGTHSLLGAEAAYVGSARSGKGSTPDLMMNGAEGVVRLQYPFDTAKVLVTPFAFGGVGWSRISLNDAPAGVKDSGDVGFVPFGGGVTLGYRRVLFDARFTYRTSFNEPDSLGAARPANLDQWSVGASVGAQF